jgi:hypothetical protein
MLSKFSMLLSGAVLCAAVSTTSLFGADAIDRRERREQARIRQGVRSGELTRQEVKKLEKEQGRIKAAEFRAKADGNFTPKEKAHVEKKLNQASRDIYRQKHDNQTR